ncbi:1-deoxy-D-xylulose-5-phosphate reductoisomerase [Patescibacteria group bacterium]|nr:1-deoxy-D-xylulose-5-phosphate reductoisomerase [Patescibacteria group bacterium]MCL5091368.1 1-deoxy-D-xylulose-5-phosphate reductoisomerase [Patescibacteria group bacterium]
MKKIVILGSTGSIGTQTLVVIKRHPDRFRLVGLVCRSQIERLEQQIKEFRPRYAAVIDQEPNRQLSGVKGVRLFSGEAGMLRLVKEADYDLMVVAISGAKGLRPTLEAIRAGKDVALATKEVMVLAGELINQEIRRKNQERARQGKPPIRLLPIDSEHSAIWQSLRAGSPREVEKIILTCSGGALRGKTISELRRVTVEQALNHPNWKMGARITIDSATLMNKGLEVIEAKWLFNLSARQIEVVVHPQSILHSAVEFVDHSVIGQFGQPDMKIPIQYALSFPDRIAAPPNHFSLIKIGQLTFERPDHARFPCLNYAYAALKTGSTMPTVMNAADEVAVELFLQKRIAFLDIPKIIYRTMEKHQAEKQLSFAAILAADQWARRYARTVIR